MDVERALYGGEFLQTSHASETKHGPFPLSKQMMTFVALVIHPFGRFAPVRPGQVFHGATTMPLNRPFSDSQPSKF